MNQTLIEEVSSDIAKTLDICFKQATLKVASSINTSGKDLDKISLRLKKLAIQKLEDEMWQTICK